MSSNLHNTTRTQQTLLLGPSPLPNAVVCTDKRFSCPAGSKCLNQRCTPSSGQEFLASTSLDGVYIPPTGSSGVCHLVIPLLPSFCNCTRQDNAATVKCQANVGDRFTTLFNARFKPCDSPGSPSTIRYRWGAGIANAESGEEFQVTYQRQAYTSTHDETFSPQKARFGLYGITYAVKTHVSGVAAKQMSSNVVLDVCATGGGYSGCASDSDANQQYFSTQVGVSGARPPFLIA